MGYWVNQDREVKKESIPSKKTSPSPTSGKYYPPVGNTTREELLDDKDNVNMPPTPSSQGDPSESSDTNYWVSQEREVRKEEDGGSNTNPHPQQPPPPERQGDVSTDNRQQMRAADTTQQQQQQKQQRPKPQVHKEPDRVEKPARTVDAQPARAHQYQKPNNTDQQNSQLD